MKVFLGGTTPSSDPLYGWRGELISMLDKEGIEYFNPVKEDWTPEDIQHEFYQKELECNTHLYVITKEMKGVFSIAEAVDSTWSKNCIFYVMTEGFDVAQLKSLNATIDLINKRGGIASSGNDIKNVFCLLKGINSLEPMKSMSENLKSYCDKMVGSLSKLPKFLRGANSEKTV